MPIDWDSIHASFKPYAAFVAGLLFGAAWWCWADAVTYSVAIAGSPFNALWLLPGCGATLAILVMNCVTRDELDHDLSFNEAAVVCHQEMRMVQVKRFACHLLRTADG